MLGAPTPPFKKLRHQPDDMGKFAEMMKAVMAAAATVLERQYFNLTAKLAVETRSARSHNIDSEEIMGMFSALKMKSPNATICFITTHSGNCQPNVRPNHASASHTVRLGRGCTCQTRGKLGNLGLLEGVLGRSRLRLSGHVVYRDEIVVQWPAS